MTIRNIIFLILSISFIQVTHGQSIQEDTIVRKSRKFEIPQHRWGITLTSLTHLYPTLQLSYDRKVNENTEFSVEGGFSRNRLRKAAGFRIRPSIERYLLRDKYIGFFVGAAFNNMNIWEIYDYEIYFEDAYAKEFTELRRRHLFGAFMTGGFKISFAGQAFLELSSGLGPSVLFNSKITQPNDNLNSNIWSEANGWSSSLSFYSNLNFSFPLGGN